MPHIGPILEGVGKTDYERYLRVPELLELQKPVDKLVNPEERLFQTTHQTAELWLKQVDYEIDRAARLLSEANPEQAADLFERCTRILDLLREQIVILETMAPADYHVIRTSSLGRGSGQESPGFSKLLDVGARTWPAFQALLDRQNLSLLEIERKPREHGSLFRLIQGMLNYDAAFMKWRYTHLRLAVRIIGSKVVSLKNVPVMQLEAGTREAQYPELWDTISTLTGEFKPTY